MNEITQKKSNFLNIYDRSYRLAAAVFMVSNVIDRGEEIREKIKSLSLKLISMSVNLKDTNISDARKLVADIERTSMELMSMLDIASVSGMVSKMNGDILRGEFQSFIAELNNFSEKFESDKNVSIKDVFTEPSVANNLMIEKSDVDNVKRAEIKKEQKNNNGYKRKDMRKNMILDYIKGHNNSNIKDIMPNITGCSEKTIQRELVELIKEGKINKSGERRWSRYSFV